LGTRTLTSLDLGYHLAYGEHALATGRLVDHNDYIYTLPPEGLSSSDRPAPGPGSWYDERGRYRFPNANWLSQVSMAAVYRWRGVTGLCLLTVGLTLALGLLALRISRRLELSWVAAAAGLVWLGLVGYSRFNLRPELFGYVAFAGELALLGPIVVEPRRAAEIDWRLFVPVAVLHLAYVNLHSYWLLGSFVSAAIFFECCVRSILAPRGDAGRHGRRLWRRARLRSGALLAALFALSFANPWTWRLAALPLETLVYLQEHQIGGVAGAHPWSYILEFRKTLHPGFPDRVSDFAIAGMLLLAGLGSVAALLRRRWAQFIVLTGMAVVALSMRRNVAAAALAVIPFGLAAVSPLVERFVERLGAARRSISTLAVCSGVIAVAAAITFSIVTNRFYLSEGHPMRFGIGIAHANLPIGAAQWLDAHLPDARVWCDMASSSTLHFFTRPHREVPVLSNTWAYPPAIMTELREVRSLQRPVERLVDEYGAEVAVFDYESSSALFRALVEHPIWELVHVEGRNVVFVRIEGSQADIAGDQSLSALSDVQAYVTSQRRLDPALESALLYPGIAYLRAGLGMLAVETFTAIIRERPSWTEAWNYLGLSHLARARQTRGQDSLDFDAARDAFTEAVELEPGNEVALRNLDKLSRLLDRPKPGERSRALEDEQRWRDPL
jgi:hypothetical protein